MTLPRDVAQHDYRCWGRSSFIRSKASAKLRGDSQIGEIVRRYQLSVHPPGWNRGAHIDRPTGSYQRGEYIVMFAAMVVLGNRKGILDISAVPAMKPTFQ